MSRASGYETDFLFDFVGVSHTQVGKEPLFQFPSQ